MKAFVLSVFTFLTVGQAQALEVGDSAPCVMINHISPARVESEHCIRDAKVESQKKVLEFFLTTCSDCLANLPKFSDLAHRFGSTATFRLIGIDRNEMAIRSYLATHAHLIGASGIDTGLDTDRDAKKAYGVVATPTLFVLDHNNTIIYKHVGQLTAKDITELETILK